MNPDETKVCKYPICPNCGCNTIVAYGNPENGEHELYCANGLKNCQYRQNVKNLTTPLDEPRYNMPLETLKTLRDIWATTPHGFKMCELLLDDAIKFKEENPDK